MFETNNTGDTAFAAFYVGHRYPKWRTGNDGFILEWDNSAGFILYAFLNSPSVEEVAQFQTDVELEVCYKTVYDVCFFTFRFGDMPWADCPFAPALYKEAGREAVFDDIPEGQGLAVTILLIDSSCGELKTIRVVALSHDFSVKWQTWAIEANKRPLTKAEYSSLINVVYMNHSTEGIAECAKQDGNSCIIAPVE